MIIITSSAISTIAAYELYEATLLWNCFRNKAHPKIATYVPESTIEIFSQALRPNMKPMTEPISGPVIQNGNQTKAKSAMIPYFLTIGFLASAVFLMRSKMFFSQLTTRRCRQLKTKSGKKISTTIVSIVRQTGMTWRCSRPSEYPKAIAAARPNMTCVAVIATKICEFCGETSSLTASQKVYIQARATPVIRSRPSGEVSRVFFN